MSAKKDTASITRAHQAWGRYTRARDSGHTEYIEEAQTFDAFYYGDQWDEKDQKELEAAGRPALTINTILPAINTVLGEQAANRAELRFKPRRKTNADKAPVLNRLMRYILDDNQYDWKESEVFADGVIADRGFLSARMNFERNAMGEVEILVEDGSDIIPDPDAKSYDPDTWNEFFKTRWVSLDTLAEDYGEEALKKVKGQIFSRDSFDTDAYRFRGTYGDTRSIPDDPHQRAKDLRSIRLVEWQYKVRKKVPCFVAPTGDIIPVPQTWSDERIDERAQAEGYEVIERMRSCIQWVVIAGDSVIVHDELSPFSRFNIVPFFPYYRRGRPFGMVRNLISPQEQTNKLSSQELHIVNTTANSGWMVEEGSLADGMTLEQLEREGSKTGLIVKFNPGTTPPQKIQPNQIPTGIDRLSQKSQASIRDISGIHQAMQGGVSPEMSGKALQQQISRGQVQIQKPTDNLARTRFYLARLLLEMVQTFYTEERVFYITNDMDPDAEDEEVVINQQTAAGIVNDMTLGEYDIMVSQAPAVDTYNDTQFHEALMLAEKGVPIPPHILVEYSNLSRRTEMAEMLKKQAGMAEPTEEEMQLLQFQQQAQIQDIQLSLAEKQAKVDKLMAETEKLSAETESEINPEAIKNQLEIARIQKELQEHFQQLQARVELAQQSYQQRAMQQQHATLTQIRQQDTQQETQLAVASMQNQRMNQNPPKE